MMKKIIPNGVYAPFGMVYKEKIFKKGVKL